tara:strand:- start:554 stop:1066 length:513 start_codon:yes stop_codon:yes gene_type:complete
MSVMSITHDSPPYNAGADTSPACFAAKVRALRTMLYEDAPIAVPDAVAATFVGDDDTGAQPVTQHAPRAGFVLATAQHDLVAIAEDLGVQHVVKTDDPRVTVRLRSLLDGISTTLQGEPLPLLAQETATTDDGTNVTNMVALCQHADNLIAGLKGTSSQQHNDKSACVVQ